MNSSSPSRTRAPRTADSKGKRSKGDANGRSALTISPDFLAAMYGDGVEHFYTLATHAPVGIFVSDASGGCTYVNDHWCALTGLTQEQAHGEGWTKAIHPEDYERVMSGWRQASEHGDASTAEFRFQRADGKVTWIQGNAIRLLDSESKLTGYIGTVLDITERKEAEQALQLKEKQLRAVTEVTAVMLTQCSRDLRYTFVNRAASDFLGFPPEEIIGQPIAKIIGETAFEKIKPSIEVVLQGQPIEFEIEVPYRKAGRRFVRVSYTPDRNERNEVVGWVAAFSDVTDWKHAEQRLRVRDGVNRALAEASSLKEVAPRILQALCQMGGWDVGGIWKVDERAKVMSCVDFWHAPDATFPDFEEDTRARTFTSGAGLPGRVWKNGEPVWINDLARDNNFPRAAVAAKEGLHSGVCFPIKLGREVLGAIECFSATTREKDERFLELLTAIGDKLGQFIERKEAEEGLRKNEQWMQLILGTALDAVITLDQSGSITSWNLQAETTFGWTSSEVIGKSFSVIAIPPENREALKRNLRQYPKTGAGPFLGKRTEITAIRRNGQLFPAEIAVTPLVGDTEIAFSAFVRDITERKQAEASLHRVQDELEVRVRGRTLQLTQANEALQASEAKFRGFIESAPDATVIMGEDGRIALINVQTERLFGYTREELHGKPMEILFPERIRRRYPRRKGGIFANLRAGPMGKGLELSARHKDSREFPVEISLSPLETPAGVLMCAAIRDITDRKRAENALRESESRLQAIMDNSPAMIFLKDVRGRYLHANQRFLREFHLTSKQLLGKTDTDIFPPIQAKTFRRNDKKVIKAKQPLVFDEEAMHDDGLHSNIVTKYPLRGANGEIYAVGGIVTDITERRRAEEALRENEKNLTDFFNQSPLGLLWISPDGVVLRANQAQLELMDCTQRKCLGRPVKDFFIDPETIAEALRQLSRHGTLQNFRARLQRPSRGIRHVLIDANGLWRKDRFLYSRWFVRDITDRVQLEQEILAISEREQQRLGHDLHDDLCQQLSGIEFLSQTLARQLTTSAAAEAVRAREIAGMIRQAMDHARQLARGLSPMPLALVDDGLRAALGELADRTQQLFHVSCRARCDAPVHMADKSVGIHLYRIAQEAISNAIKHGGAKRIDIKLRVASDGIILGVSDNGVGFPSRQQKRKGMGLRVMQYRASVLGGSLTVHRRPTGGTTVECRIKLSKTGKAEKRQKGAS